jgi:hypothetical protein
MKISRRSGVVLAAAAAALFVSGVVTVTTSAQAGGVHCAASNACKGQNSCKGQGYLETASADECTAKGGKVLGS